MVSTDVKNNSPIQDYVQPDDQTQPTFDMTPGFKPFTVLYVNMLFIVGKHSAATESMYLSGYLHIKSEKIIQG